MALFIVHNFKKKILRADPDLWQCIIYGAKMSQLAQTRIYFGKAIKFLSTSWSISLFKIFKKSLEQIHSYEDALFLGSKRLIVPNRRKFSEKVAVFFWSTYCKIWKKIIRSNIKKIKNLWNSFAPDKWAKGQTEI